MKNIVLFNNKFLDEKDAKISIFSLAFKYGYGVFETFRTYNGKILGLEEHLQRLFKSAEKIELNIPVTQTTLKQMVGKVMKRSKLKNRKIRITVVEEGVFISSEAIRINKAIYQKGAKCISVKISRPHPEAKTLSYLESCIAYRRAMKKNCDEAILIENNNEVTECSKANLFWFEGDTIFTRKDKVLAGITRDALFKISPFKIKFKKIRLNELIKKKEIFYSQSVYGIVPISNIDGHFIGKPGERTKLLSKLLKKHFDDASMNKK